MGRSWTNDEDAPAAGMTEEGGSKLMTVQTVHPEPWPVWARVLVVTMVVLVIATLVPWIFMGVAMAAGCSGMMGNSPSMPMMR